MILLMWIAFGALINSILMNLSFIDGLYFTVVTIETVGFGDIVPRTTGARIFWALHATMGVLNLALAVSTCRETIIESFEHSYKKHLHALFERHRERKAHRAEMRAKKLAIRKQLERAGLPVYVSASVGGGRSRKRKVHLNVEALTAQQKADAMNEALTGLEDEDNPAYKLERRTTFHSALVIISRKPINFTY